MAKTYFLFGVHNHQPVGNFPHIFERAYRQCYLPFITQLEEFPGIKCSIHISGPLYDWLMANAKEYLEILKKLINRKQVEVVSGGYYEPILPLVLDFDKIGQINLMNSFIEHKFRQRPKGIWVAERIWEPYLARIIRNCKLEYTFLDDTHFRYAGLRQKEFFGYYTTEEEAKSIFVFPISKTLRYKIPFSLPEEAIDILRGFSQESDVLITLFDDGEKFGLWPHTFEWVYQKNWLKRFFSLLEKSKDIETIAPAEAINRFSTNGIIYLPTASYEEMGEWVMEPETFSVYQELNNFLKQNQKIDLARDFIRGGFFRNFYRKYPRLNYMHKRMLYLSAKINQEATLGQDKDMFLSLWKAQTNCGYWHGIFGGFYLGHIRGSIYENLINAENAFDKKYAKKGIILEEADIDLDGRKELILKNDKIICCFSSKGATLLELSLRRPAFNLLNTITRRQESYHKKIKENIKKENDVTTIHETVTQKDKDLDKFLIYDKYERLGLVDHLLDKNLTLEDFNRQDGVVSLSNTDYTLKINKTKQKFSLGYLYKAEDLEFLKKIDFSSSAALEVFYQFKRNARLKKHNFGVEINLAFPSLDNIFNKQPSRQTPLNKPRIWADIQSFTVVDNHKKISLEFRFDTADVFCLPLYSVSSSESGFEKVYQQISLLFITKRLKNSFRLLLKAES